MGFLVFTTIIQDTYKLGLCETQCVQNVNAADLGAILLTDMRSGDQLSTHHMLDA